MIFKLIKKYLLALLLAILLLTYFVSENGLLMAYMKASGLIVFATTVLLLYLIRKMDAVDKANNKLELKAIYSGFPLNFLIGALQFTAVWGTLFLCLYLFGMLSDYTLLKLTSKERHVLFPCSQAYWTEEMKKETLTYWKKSSLDDFSCEDSRTYESFD